MGQTREECLICHDYTGKAGVGDGSIYDLRGDGPYCENCWDQVTDPALKEDDR